MATETLNTTIADDLYLKGWSIQPGYLEIGLVRQLAIEARQLWDGRQMIPAGIGRGGQWQRNPAIRQDFIHWLAYDTATQRKYQALMATLRQTLNRSLMLGLVEFEAHYAVYEAGAFYQKHFDSFQGKANRIVSIVTYLNVDWPPAAGGELLIYQTGEENVICTVPPQAGTLVVFLSETIPHAVAAAHQRRMSIAGWFRGYDPL